MDVEEETRCVYFLPVPALTIKMKNCASVANSYKTRMTIGQAPKSSRSLHVTIPTNWMAVNHNLLSRIEGRSKGCRKRIDLYANLKRGYITKLIVPKHADIVPH